MATKKKPDVFVCHSSQDAAIAHKMVAALENGGMRCWIAPRDIPVGADWAAGIHQGIADCKVMVLIFSGRSNESEVVKNEVSMAASRKIPIIPFKIEAVPFAAFFDLHLARLQWQDALTGLPEEHFGRLLNEIRELVPARKTRGKLRGAAPASIAGNGNTADSTVTAPKPPITPKDGDELSSLQNPYEFDATATRKTFKGRHTEIEELLDSVETGTHTAVFGLQRMGKTSLIAEGLVEGLERRPGLAKSVLSASIDMQGLGGEQVKYRDFVQAILESITTRLSALGIGRSQNDLRGLMNEMLAEHRFPRGDRTQFFAMFGKLLRGFSLAAHRRIVLFIDEFSEVRKVIERNKSVQNNNAARTQQVLPHDMYLDVAFMHHLSFLLKERELKKHFTLIISVRPFMAEYDDKAELQLLKLMKPIILYHLDEPAAKALITEPVARAITYEQGAVDYLWRLTGGHPYILQFLLKLLVDRVKRQPRRQITLNDILEIESRMVREGPAYDAVFEVLISDYSVAEILHPQEADLGKGMLALIAKLGDESSDYWVFQDSIFDALVQNALSREKSASLLSQLSRTKILEEANQDGNLCYRLAIPLLRKRFVTQNLYQKYFRGIA